MIPSNLSFFCSQTNSYLYVVINKFVISWWTGEWQECSGTCFNGGQGYQKRSVLCVKQRSNELDESKEIVVVPDSECDAASRPRMIEKCEIDMSKCDNQTGYWITEEWNRVNMKYFAPIFRIKITILWFKIFFKRIA